jgi:hypothetical protein
VQQPTKAGTGGGGMAQGRDIGCRTDGDVVGMTEDPVRPEGPHNGGLLHENLLDTLMSSSKGTASRPPSGYPSHS